MVCAPITGPAGMQGRAPMLRAAIAAGGLSAQVEDATTRANSNVTVLITSGISIANDKDQAPQSTTRALSPKNGPIFVDSMEIRPVSSIETRPPQEEPSMKIIVLVKEVPDTYGDRKLNLETGLADREASDAVIDEIGERALELALTYADANDGTEVAMLSLAPEGATATIRKGLAMGAGSATHICDEALRGADLGLTAETLAAAIRRVEFDLV